MSILPHIKDESSTLKSVVLGLAKDFGGTPEADQCYDPKSTEHVLAGTFPVEADLVKEMDAMNEILLSHGVKVYRPENIPGLNQIFSRDISFVIDNTLHIANVIGDREREIEGIKNLIQQIDPAHIHHMPDEMRAEGGDIMPYREFLFVGYSEPEDFARYEVARTNRAGLDYLIRRFPNRLVKGFQLKKSDTVARDNALHLDCCFQPIGGGRGIIYPGGFKNPEDVEFLQELFGKDNLIEITQEEMYHMFSNIFSISPEVIVSNASFKRLNAELRSRGFHVEEVPYDEISKMEGLLRCTTMPLIRE